MAYLQQCHQSYPSFDYNIVYESIYAKNRRSLIIISKYSMAQASSRCGIVCILDTFYAVDANSLSCSVPLLLLRSQQSFDIFSLMFIHNYAFSRSRVI